MTTTAIAKRTPPTEPVWRAWNRDWRLTGSWNTRPPMDALTEGGGLTVDYPNGVRQSWHIINGELIDENELLKAIKVPANPYLGGDHDHR